MNRSFSSMVLNEAKQISLSSAVFNDRKQIRGITIDPSETLDIDDAIWIDIQGSESIVHISIADVASIVPFGSHLEQEAVQRTMTLYRKRVDPMFPFFLSHNLLSLKEGEPRLTLTVSIYLSQNVKIQKVEIQKTYLVNEKRLTYAQADEILDSPQHPYFQMLSRSLKLAHHLF